jgi:hypothetical protein
LANFCFWARFNVSNIWPISKHVFSSYIHIGSTKSFSNFMFFILSLSSLFFYDCLLWVLYSFEVL